MHCWPLAALRTLQRASVQDSVVCTVLQYIATAVGRCTVGRRRLCAAHAAAYLMMHKMMNFDQALQLVQARIGAHSAHAFSHIFARILIGARAVADQCLWYRHVADACCIVVCCMS
jgi:hypothetical protein